MPAAVFQGCLFNGRCLAIEGWRDGLSVHLERILDVFHIVTQGIDEFEIRYRGILIQRDRVVHRTIVIDHCRAIFAVDGFRPCYITIIKCDCDWIGHCRKIISH